MDISKIKERLRGIDRAYYVSSLLIFLVLISSLFEVLAGPGATLNVSISAPPNLTQFSLNKIINVTSKITCQVSNCNEVMATVRFNLSQVLPFTPVNSTDTNEKPLNVILSKYTKGIFNVTIAPADTDGLRDVVVDSNNQFIYVVGQDEAPLWLIRKYNATGKSIWNKTYEKAGTGSEDARGIVLDSSESNIYIFGDNGGDQFELMKMNVSGYSIWNRTYALTGGTETGYDIEIDPSDNLYIVGASNSLWQVMKINATGKSIWNKTYSPGDDDAARDIEIDSTGTFIYVSGWAEQGQDNNWHIKKLNTTGYSIWNRTYNFTGDGDRAFGARISKDDKILYVVGNTSVRDIGIMKINTSGYSIWNKSFNPGTVDYAEDAEVDSMGNLILIGTSGNTNTYFMKLAPDGTSIWNISYAFGNVNRAGFGLTIDKENDIYAVAEGNIAGSLARIFKLGGSLSYQTCGNVTTSGTCTFTWSVNATRNGGYYIGVFYNSTGLAAVNVTNNITIRVGDVQGGADSCTPPGSGDWVITDICFKNTNIALSGAGAKVIIGTNGWLICHGANITNAGRKANFTIKNKLSWKGASNCGYLQ